jgi:hypothetical protein
LPATKPYFTVVDGEVVLNENPIQNKGDIDRLKDEAFLKEIAEHDYWARKILDRPDKKFPYVRLLFDLDFLSQTKDIILGKDTAKYSEARSSYNLWKNPTYVAIMKHIFATFVEEAKKTGETPILMLLPRGQNIRSVLSGQRYPGEGVVRAECRDKGYLCILPADFMAERIGSIEQIPEYYFRGGVGHPTPKATELIAQAVYRFLQDKALIEN